MIPEPPRKTTANKSSWTLLIATAVIVALVLSFTQSSSNTTTAKSTSTNLSPKNELQDIKKDLSLLQSQLSSMNSKLLDQLNGSGEKLEQLRSDVHKLKKDDSQSKISAPPEPTFAKRQNVKVPSTHQPSSERLAPYVNKNYVRKHEGGEWSFDKLEREYKTQLQNAIYPRLGTNITDPNILFIDGREQCENARGFLITVRQSGFRGKIIFLVYRLEDEADCQPLANDFQPMLIYYHDTPLYEATMLQYHGLANFALSFPEELEVPQRKAIVVKPEAVFWCNKTNPFDDIPKSDNENALYGVIGRQTDMHTYDLKIREPTDSCTNPQGRWNGTEADSIRKENTLVDSFVAATSIRGLVKFASLLLSEHPKHERDEPRAPYDLFRLFDVIKQYLNTNLVEMSPINLYSVADCHSYLPDIPSCLTCEAARLVVGTASCVRRVQYEIPNYTPYCLQPYRDAILEVPYKTSMVSHAGKNILAGAHMIRDKPEGIFSEPADPSRSVTAQCPYGTLGIVSMMAGYDIQVVHRFIGSYLSNADPICAKLIMIIKPDHGLESVAKHFPNRVEFVLLNESSEYYPVKLRGCKPADSRFEVAQRWLEKNYHRFRYVIAPDSRDYVWQADPFAQLIKILERQGYTDDEFIASVAEPYVVGGTTYPSGIVSLFLRLWIGSCGQHCFRKISKLRYTNGDPFAVLNSGHIIGTSLGLLHYFRFHVRMMNESGHKCDGTDQGLFTYYMYGMLQEAHYPHKVLVFSSSRSGFANMPPPARVAKRIRTDNPVDPEVEMVLDYYSQEGFPMQDRFDNLTVHPNLLDREYMITDCDNNIIAGLHQFDRYSENFYIERNPKVWRPWAAWKHNKTFLETFGKPEKKEN